MGLCLSEPKDGVAQLLQPPGSTFLACFPCILSSLLAATIRKC